MKEKIYNIINNKYFGLILVIIINLIFFIVCNSLFALKYEQVDDFIIMNLISKMDGNYSLYGIQMHPIICGIIILLYKTAININWYTIFLLFMQFISLTIIGTVFVNKSKSIGIPLYITLILTIYSKMLSYIQYTTVSMLCITSGLILLIYSLTDREKVKKSTLIISIFMILMGCMIRFSTIIIAIPFIMIYFAFKAIKERNLKIIKILSIVFIGIFLVYFSFNIFYNMNPIYKDFLKFHDARTYLHDYNWMSYENNKGAFESANWSKNDRDIFYAYCFGDEKIFNTEMLEKIKENVSNNHNDNILKKSISTFNIFTNSVKNKDYKFIFLITVMLVICNNLSVITNKSKNERDDTIKIAFINSIFLAIIFMHCLFIFLNRPMFRVIISIYIIGNTILLYLLINKNKFSFKQIIKYVFIFSTIIVSILEFKQNIYYSKYYDKENYSIYKEILKYTNSHKENAYLYTLVMHDRYLAYSVYEKIPDNSYDNIRPLGDWDTYTKNYYNFNERYNIKNPLESLYKNDNVYLISGNVIWGENYKEYINIIVKYIKEHYNVDVECKIVKEFDNDIKVYKLQEKDKRRK